VWLAALVTVESGWSVDAASAAGAVGPLQLTYIGMAEASAECGLAPLPLEAMADWQVGMHYGTCLLTKYLRESDGDWPTALVLYNGGYRQLARLKEGQPLAAETAAYVQAVTTLRETCQP